VQHQAAAHRVVGTLHLPHAVGYPAIKYCQLIEHGLHPSDLQAGQGVSGVSRQGLTPACAASSPTTLLTPTMLPNNPSQPLPALTSCGVSMPVPLSKRRQ
jgi:hypothetical protein